MPSRVDATEATPRRGRRAADLEPGRRLRGAIADVFSAHAGGQRPPKASLRALLAAYGEAVENGVLASGAEASNRLDWVWTGRHADRPLWPIAVAAVDLLRSDRLARVKRCDNCNWLFVDASRNGSRRWCSMDECGVHVKMRRYRASRRG
jgi:predicted RNA-binding Zn ribbon-like protein